MILSEFLCPTGTQWKYDQGHMSGMAKVWLYFVGARLLPTTRFDQVTEESLYGLYYFDWWFI